MPEHYNQFATEAEAENQLPQDRESKRMRNILAKDFGYTSKDEANARGAGDIGQ